MMITWIKDLFHENRSITGKGIQNALSYFEKINPELKRIKFKSGKKVFDWVVPEEWDIYDAYIQDSKGRKYCEFKKLNLHVVGFSIPINKKINRRDLLPYLHTNKKIPNAVPYVTSYYNKTWGFCLSESEKSSLPNGKYKVYINSKFTKGNLHLSHALIRGKSNKEIFFSSYLCHPSMANNELSGPAVLNEFLRFLKSKKKLNYSYRFVLLPETIGSICYLSKFSKTLKKNMVAGYNLSCLGDSRAYSYVKTPSEKTLADLSIKAALIGKKNVKEYDFNHRGSDERQYCSSNIDLPVVNFSRSKFGAFKEYHTNLDNLNIISQKNLLDSCEVLKNITYIFENCLYPKSKIKCEPFLSSRNLYNSLSKDYYKYDFSLRDLNAYANGKRSFFEIAIKSQHSLIKLINAYKILSKFNIIK